MWVLLTATVTPQVDESLRVVDPEVRRAQYRAAIFRWWELCRDEKLTLVIGENSGEDLPGLVQSALGFRPPEIHLVNTTQPSTSVVSRGKGATEGLLIRDVVDALGSESDGEFLFKCTGRLFVKNFRQCMSRMPSNDSNSRVVFADIPRSKFEWIDSRFFGASLAVWRQEFRDLGSLSNDSAGINFENELAHAINLAAAGGPITVKTMSEKPWIVGQSGTTGERYAVGVPSLLKRHLLRPADQLRRRLDDIYTGYK
jgi:hypothetical protein